MAKKTEFKSIKQRAKEIADKIKIETVDQYNWKIKKGLDDKQMVEALRTLSHFITIPTQILNEEETKMFDENLFEKINVTKK